MVVGQQGQVEPTNNAPPAGSGLQSSAVVEEVWDEAHLEDSLKTLKEMHIQVSDLVYVLTCHKALIDSLYSSGVYELRFHDSLRPSQ